MKNVFSMNEEEMNNATSKLNQVKNTINGAVGSMSNSFRNLNSTGLFDTSPIEKSMNKYSQSIENTRLKMNLYTESTMRRELMMKNKASEIDVPKDFVKNDNIQYNDIDDIKLNKEDGKAIKNDNKQDKLDVGVESEVLKEDLKNISREETQKAEKVDDNTIEKEKLQNIKTEDTKEVENLDDSSVEKENLGHIITTETQKVQEDMDSAVNKLGLSNLTNNDASYTSNNTNSYVSSSAFSSDNEEKSDEEEFMKSYAMYEEYMKNKNNDKDGE